MHSTSAAPGQRGAVRNPQFDRRLKQNRQNPGPKASEARAKVQPGGQGRVKNPETDRRLKSNR
jgi:hypothetical protein